MSRRRLVVVLAALSLGACATSGARRTTPKAADTVSLRVLCSVPDTRLYFDGGLVLPRCGPEGVLLPAPRGSHRLEARHENFFAEFVDLEIGPTAAPVAVTMRPVPSLLQPELEGDAPP